jgi:hypothetical protein
MPEKALPAWNQYMADFVLSNTERTCLPGEEAFLEIEQRVRAAGAELILVVFPNFVPNRRLFVGPCQAGWPLVWSFDRPEEFPSLYDPVNRETETHINHFGAQIFTDALAEHFAEYLRTGAPAAAAAGK